VSAKYFFLVDHACMEIDHVRSRADASGPRVLGTRVPTIVNQVRRSTSCAEQHIT
jgi:hypothetical protein